MALAFRTLVAKGTTLLILLSCVGAVNEAAAQASAPTRRVAILSPNARESAISVAAYAEIRRVLAEKGFVEGRSLAIDARWGEGVPDRDEALARELMAKRPDVMIVMTTRTSRIAKAVAGSTPLVMVNVVNPVEQGLVASLSKPGGSATGVLQLGMELSAKSIEVIKQVLPSATTVGVLVAGGGSNAYMKVLEEAARNSRVTLVPIAARTRDDLPGAIEAAKKKTHALLLLGGGIQSGNRELIAELAIKAKLPVFAQVRPYVEAGILASYGQAPLPQYTMATDYAARILKGANPADLPVLQPSQFELVINAKTARALGVKIPESVSARVTEIIE
jgi:putative tryptophan/tyrosine transport system substrate-binding protein